MKIKPVFVAISLVTAFTLTACGTANTSSAPQSSVNTADNTSSSDTKTQTNVAAKGPVIYTANEGGSINVIDATSNKVLQTIKEDGVVHNAQVSPDGKVLGATFIPGNMGENDDEAMQMNGYALFFDTSTNQLIKKVEVGAHPAHIVFTQNGKYALVTNNAGNNVSVIDTSTYDVVRTIPTGKGPHGFRISKDSKYAYVADMGSDTVSVLDLTNFKLIKQIKVGTTPVTTGITSDGKTLVATSNKENTLAIVDLATDQVQKVEVGKGPAQVYIEPDDKYAFVANQGTKDNPSNSVSKIDLATKKVVATIETGKGSHGVVTSPDNREIYVTNMYENTVSVIDNATNKVVATVNVDKVPNGITFKP